MNNKYCYWNETLESISKDQRNDKFKFIINQNVYEIPLSLAIGLSPLISEKYLTDPTFNSFFIDDEDLNKEFSNFLEGKPILDSIYYKIGKYLGNNKMIQKMLKKTEITKDTVGKLIYFKRNNENMDIKEELGFMSQHIDEMEEEIYKLNVEEVLYLFRLPTLKIDSENTLWKILKHFLLNEKREIFRQQIFGCINILFLSKEHFVDYIETIDSNSIDIHIWNSLKNCIYDYVENIPFHSRTLGTNKITIEYKNEPFNGLFNYLHKKCDGNPHEKKIITVSASSNIWKNPETVLDYPNIEGWQSDMNPNNWIQFNFKTMMVNIDGYSLKTYNRASNIGHLKNWVIEGSSNGSEWVEIDKRENNNDLNGCYFEHYFPISTRKSYQYIRIRSIGKDHCEDSNTFAISHYMTIVNFEIFGSLFQDDTIEIPKNNTNNDLETGIIKIDYKEDYRYEGIFHYLIEKTGFNNIQNKITIKGSSSTYGTPLTVIDYNSSSYWSSNNVPNNWWEVNFKKMKVKINGYFIQTGPLGANGFFHLKNWVIEGSNDNNSWTEIDKKENNSDLNGHNLAHYFPLSQLSDSYQYIRLRSIGINHFLSNNTLMFSKFDLFGEIDFGNSNIEEEETKEEENS